MRRKPGQGTIGIQGYITVTFGSVGSWKGKKYTGFKKLAHHVVAEKALGRELRGSEEVHHLNEVKTDNTPGNLVICPDRAYHMMVHQRTRAFDACGHADWLRCPYCKSYDDPSNFKFRPRGRDRPGQNQWTHAQCARDYAAARAASRKV